MAKITAAGVGAASRAPGAGDVGFSQGTSFAGSLSGSQRDAYTALFSLFKSYGLESLAPKIFDFVKQGYSADTISLLLQDTKEYKQRFAANDARLKAGLPVLSPADYINTENAYRQVFRQSGLPNGFYDNTSDFTNFIAKDVSPSELQSRVQLTQQAVGMADPNVKAALKQFYGLDENSISAYFLDPDRALPLLQKQAGAAAIGAEALKTGLDLNRSNFEAFAASGVTAQQAQQAFAQVSTDNPGLQAAAGAFGESLSQFEEEQALLGQVSKPTGGESAASKLSRLESWNRARAQGAAGAAAGGLTASRSGTV